MEFAIFLQHVTEFYKQDGFVVAYLNNLFLNHVPM